MYPAFVNIVTLTTDFGTCDWFVEPERASAAGARMDVFKGVRREQFML
jgi:hypothetical protein